VQYSDFVCSAKQVLSTVWCRSPDIFAGVATVRRFSRDSRLNRAHLKLYADKALLSNVPFEKQISKSCAEVVQIFQNGKLDEETRSEQSFQSIKVIKLFRNAFNET
jgi:hypothetical protein